MNGEIKVGIFVLVGSVLIGTAIFLLGDYSLQKYYNIKAEFSDVAGLPDKSTVKLSGVEVGKIEKIYLKEDHVVVELDIKRGVKIYRNAKFLVGSTSMIGSKFMQVDQGTQAAGVLEDGDTVHGENIIPLERALSHAVASLDSLVGDIRGQGSLARNLDEILTNLREVTANINELVMSTKPHAEKAMANIDSLTGKVDALMTKTDAIVDKINNGEGVAGALVSDPKMKQNVTDTLTNMRDASASVKDVLGRINGFRIFMNWDYRYEALARTSRDDVGIKIYPREGHYFALGGSNLTSSKNRVKGVDYEAKNSIDALMGWDGRGLDFYAGALHGAGGGGLSWAPFYNTKWDHLSLMLEASDFSRDRKINGRSFTKPRVDAGVTVKLNRNLSAGVRLNDLEETKRFEYTTRVLFEDKDIAYLFGLISFGSAGTKGRSSSNSK